MFGVCTSKQIREKWGRLGRSDFGLKSHTNNLNKVGFLLCAINLFQK